MHGPQWSGCCAPGTVPSGVPARTGKKNLATEVTSTSSDRDGSMSLYIYILLPVHLTLSGYNYFNLQHVSEGPYYGQWQGTLELHIHAGVGLNSFVAAIVNGWLVD